MQNEDINKKEIKKNCKRKNANVIDKAKYLYYIVYPDLRKYFEELESKVNLQVVIKELENIGLSNNQEQLIYLPFIEKIENNTKELFNVDVLLENKISKQTLPTLEICKKYIMEIIENLSQLNKVADVYSKNQVIISEPDLSNLQVETRLEVIDRYIQEIKKYFL